jgi:hypothetical protein
MRFKIVLLVVAGVMLTACAKPRPAAEAPVAARACDDGGDGGVMIDGVCL